MCMKMFLPNDFKASVICSFHFVNKLSIENLRKPSSMWQAKKITLFHSSVDKKKKKL